MPNFPIDERGYTFSHVLDREVKLTPAMQHLVRALNTHGDVDPIRDGLKTGTIVALMDRGILREAKGRYGRYQMATTPEQVYDEARAQADAEEGWGQPDGMLGVTEVDHAATGRAIIEQAAAALHVDLDEPWAMKPHAFSPTPNFCGAVEATPTGTVTCSYSAKHPIHGTAAPTTPAAALHVDLDGPVIIEANVEQMNQTTDTLEIPRAEWNAMTPVQRRKTIADFGATTMNNAGGYGAGILSGAPDTDLEDPPTTPAEVRTGISDRTAAALTSIARLLDRYGAACAAVARPTDDREAVEPFDLAMRMRRRVLDRIEAALRGER